MEAERGVGTAKNALFRAIPMGQTNGGFLLWIAPTAVFLEGKACLDRIDVRTLINRAIAGVRLRDRGVPDREAGYGFHRLDVR